MTTDTQTPPIRFAHFGVNCFDMKKMEEFYKQAFGLVETDRGYVPHIDLNLVFLTLDPKEHHQIVLSSGRKEGEIVKDAFIGGGAGSAINQISFVLRDLEQMRKVAARFAEFGITNGSAINHGIAWALYIRDIEGNPIELYVNTPWYIPQPCAEMLDLGLSDKEIYELTEKMCLSSEGYEPMAQWQERIAQKLAVQLEA
ncbi:MAG: VOC family protein [Pseudomonadota bacterium]